MKQIMLKLRSFSEQLAFNDKVIINNVTKFDEKKWLDAETEEMMIDILKEDFGILIPKEDTFIINFSDIILDWDRPQQKISDSYIYGGFRFNGIIEALTEESSFWKIYDNQVDIDLAKINYFQMSGHGYDGTFGCFYKDSDSFPFKVYFYDNGFCYETILSFKEYINAMIESCAIQNWQYFYVNLTTDLPSLDEIVSKMKFSLKNLNELFPEKDFSYHLSRIENLENRP